MTAKILLIIVLLWYISCYKPAVGFVSQSSEAVCIGETLSLTCHTNGSVIAWTVFVPRHNQGTRTNIFETNPDNATKHRVIGGIPLQFSKISNSSLISTLLVDGANVTSDLNGTVINCTGASGQLMATTILVIGNDATVPNISVINTEEQFGIENVTVVLEWAEEEHATYNVTTFPSVPPQYIRKTAVQLTVPYNSRHYVNVVATLCGHQTTNVTELHYVKCDESPPHILSATGIVVLNIADDDSMAPALVGSTMSVMISCSEEVGKSNKTVTFVCMDDAKWQVCYKSGNLFPGPICPTLSTGTAAWSQGTIAALLASVTFLIFACFITGLICGCLCHKKLSYKTFWTTGHTNEEQQLNFSNKVPVSHDLEMNENVAYGQVQSQ